MDSVIHAAIVYAFLWIVIRVTGRRALGQLTTFEFVLFLIIGGATQRALLGQDYSLINAFVVICTLVLLDVLVSLIERDWKPLQNALRNAPLILVEDGRPLARRMYRARITLDDVMEEARLRHGLEALSDVRFAILESSGKISIIPARRQNARAGKTVKPQA
jgi:uncharacterized membrane protein YcaP (DUF421 family)